MAPYYPIRDPFPGSQVHSKSIYPDSTRRHQSSGDSSSSSPLLASSSMRAIFSPRLVHGNSPLLNSVNVTPISEDVEVFPSPGQFSDAEFEEGSTSPSSSALQDQLRNATKALEELKVAVRLRRNKRHSLSSKNLTTEHLQCIGTEEECFSNTAGLGLGLLMDNLQSKLTNSPQVMNDGPSPLLVRRHWLADASKNCNTTSTSKSLPSTTASNKQVFSPQTVASPTMITSAPPTPSLESGAFATTATTPIMPSSTFSAGDNNTTKQQGQNGSSPFSTPHDSNNATAIASIGAAGSLILLAALLIAVYFRRQRSKRHKHQMASVLDKVAPPPSLSDGGEKEKQEGGAIGSNEYFAASAKKELQDIEEYRIVSPWLSLNMGSHPFASVSSKAERFSNDLADSGVVGQQVPSKDYSFNWNFPKLSVPLAAARAISTGHYVKKRTTIVPHSNSDRVEKQPIKAIIPSSSFEPRRCSSVKTHVDNMSQSASSECVDPEIDHTRKSFTILDITSRPLGWIKSAIRQLTPNQQQHYGRDIECIDNSSISSPWVPSISSRRSVSQSSEDQSISLSMQKSTTSITHFVPDSLALTQAVVQQILEIRLPSLSIANSPMLDHKDTPLSSPSTRITSLRWSSDKSTPQRSFSSGSDGTSSIVTAPQINRGGPRRVSWAGTLRSCREDSKESVLELLQSPDSTSKVTSIRRSQVWTSANNDMTDTDDDTGEGYEAEIDELDTEVEMDNNYIPSTPVITLTCSEEEGRFERQISLNSVYRESTSSDDHSKLPQRRQKIEIVDNFVGRDDDDDDGATVIMHHCDDDGNDTDSSHSGALHSLLVDDFPTIPEWTPIPTTLRSTVH